MPDSFRDILFIINRPNLDQAFVRSITLSFRFDQSWLKGSGRFTGLMEEARFFGQVFPLPGRYNDHTHKKQRPTPSQLES
jgi:hypothetical protein